MEKKQAQRLIEDTFNNSFSEEQFTVFAKNLLNDFEDKHNHYSGNLIWDDYKEHINSYKRIGKYIDPDGEAKTLIFAATDHHADMIVKILKEEFAAVGIPVPDDAVVKITGIIDKPEEKVKRYKNDIRYWEIWNEFNGSFSKAPQGQKPKTAQKKPQKPENTIPTNRQLYREVLEAQKRYDERAA